jgi:penicillin-binding protein 1A
VALSVKDGSVRALVGGARDYWQNQWNCAVNPHTAGSSLKPFIYLTAFMSGLSTPESMVQDSPFLLDEGNGKKWTPKNYDGKYLGNITIREALVQSRNMCTIYTLQQVGIAAAINTMRQAGIQSPIHPSLSLALGSPAVTPLELAAAYGTLARGGLAIAPWYIAKVEDARGRLLDVNLSNSYRVFPEEATTWIVDLLNEVVRRGTGTQAKLGARPCAGKTGTADKAKDIWFVGFTPDMITCVWGGGDEKGPRASSNVTGGSVMAQVFARFNQQYYSRVTVANGHLLSSTYYSQKTPVKETKPLSHSNDVPYWQIDNQQTGRSTAQPSSNVGRAPVRVIRQQKGITEYHWEQ